MFNLDEERFKQLIKESIAEVLNENKSTYKDINNKNEYDEYPIGANEATKYFNFKNKISFMKYVKENNVPIYYAGKKPLFYKSELKQYIKKMTPSQ